MEQSITDRIRIAAPCKANWADMQGDDRKRLCGDCSKDVYDLSAMTKREAEELFLSTSEIPCVKYFRRHDGTILFENCPRGLRKLRDAAKAVTRLVSVAFAFCLSVCGVGAAEDKVEDESKEPANFNIIWTLSESGPTSRQKMSNPSVSNIDRYGSMDISFLMSRALGIESQPRALGSDWSGFDALNRALQLVEKKQNSEAVVAFDEALVACSKPESDPVYKEFVGAEYAKLLMVMGKKSQAAEIIQKTQLKKAESGTKIDRKKAAKGSHINNLFKALSRSR